MLKTNQTKQKAISEDNVKETGIAQKVSFTIVLIKNKDIVIFPKNKGKKFAELKSKAAHKGLMIGMGGGGRNQGLGGKLQAMTLQIYHTA